MRVIDDPEDIRRILDAIELRLQACRVVAPGRARTVAAVERAPDPRFICLRVPGTVPICGAPILVSGIHSGEGFEFSCEFVDRSATGAWLLTSPEAIQVRQRRSSIRVRPGPSMTLTLQLEGVPFDADLFDLSEGGVSFSTRTFPQVPSVGEVFDGVLSLERNRDVPVSLELRHRNGLRAGGRFLSIPQPALMELRNLTTREERSGELPDIRSL